MAEIRPFRGVRYNQELIGDLSSVICPPYDVITSQMEEELYSRSQYNFIRVEHGRQLPQDTATDNKYTRSAATLEQWLRLGVLQADEKPAIYLHDHYFMHQGKQYRRRGVVASVRLEEWDKGVIRPHEGTLAAAGDDRLSLLWTLQANTSPILVMYEDQDERLSSLFAQEEQKQPVISLSTADGECHSVWAITESEVVDKIRASLAPQPLYIADGHHRYESALTYQREKRSCSSSASGEDSFDSVAMTLVSFSDPGLITLPPHRLVRGIPRASLSELPAELRSLFEVEEMPLSTPGIWQRIDDLLAEKNANEVDLILFGLDTEHLFLLRLRDFTATNEMMPYFHCDLYKRLDVSIVDHVILEKMLGLGGGGERAVLAYSYDKREAVERVLNGEYQLAFLLSPIGVGMIKAIADIGDRLPRKSTYFYPKLPSGLVFRQLV